MKCKVLVNDLLIVSLALIFYGYWIRGYFTLAIQFPILCFAFYGPSRWVFIDIKRSFNIHKICVCASASHKIIKLSIRGSLLEVLTNSYRLTRIKNFISF